MLQMSFSAGQLRFSQHSELYLHQSWAGGGKGFHGTDGVESCVLNDSCVSLMGNDTKG